MEFLDKLNELTQGKYNYLKVKSLETIIKPPQVIIELLVPYDLVNTIFGDAQREEIDNAVAQIIPKSISYKLNYIKSYVDEKIAKLHIANFFAATHPTIIIDESEIIIDIVDEYVNITLQLKSQFYNYLADSNLAENIIEYLSHHICNPVKVVVCDNKKIISYDTDFATDETIVLVSRRIKTSNHKKVVGKDITAKPKYISDVKETEKNIVYCGEIVDFRRNVSKKTGNLYYVITISDSTGLLCCKAFTKSPESSPYDSLQMGDSIIAYGNVEIDTFLHDSVLLINSLSLCDIDKSSIILKEDLRDEPACYTFIKPNVYNDCRQASLLDDSNIECPPALKNKSYVVFDFETTGLEVSVNEVIELGAVKVVDGVITETFGTFIDPQIHIPEKATEINGITDDDVVGAPKMKDVIADFYKFAKSSCLVAHNASFDKSYLDKYAKEERYLFDNQVFDTVLLAKKVVSSPNYKLITLCNKFNIKLEGAHRAVNDCEATAKLFIELVKLGAIK